MRDANRPAVFQVTPPDAAPNVLIVLVDDLGCAGPPAFGGPVSTPAFVALAAERLKFLNFPSA